MLNIFLFLVTGSVLAPLTVGLIQYPRLDPTLRLVFYYIVTSACFAAAISYSGHVLGQNNQWLLWINTSIEVVFIIYIYRSALGKLLPQWVYPALVISFSLMVAVLAALGDIRQSPSVPRTAGAILIISFCLLYFYKMSRDLSVLRLERSGMFWFTVAFLLYACVELFFFILNNQINAQPQEVAVIIYMYFNFLPIVITNLIIAIGIWQTHS